MIKMIIATAVCPFLYFLLFGIERVLNLLLTKYNALIIASFRIKSDLSILLCSGRDLQIISGIG
jgi:hypothetical protein